MPATNLRRAQFGQQTAYATPVAATQWVRGLTEASFTIEHDSAPIEELGFVANGGMIQLSPRMATGSTTFAGTYQHIRYGLQGMFGAPNTTGTAPNWTHEWVLPATTTLPSPPVFTIEYGVLPDTTTHYRAIGCVAKTLTISGRAGENPSVTWAVDWIARNLDGAAMTTALPVTNVDEMSFVHADLWIDPDTNPFGTTQINNAFIGFEWVVESNRHTKMFDDLHPSAWGDGRWSSTLTLTLEWTSQVKAIVDALLTANVLRRIRVQIELSPTRSWRVDFAGVLTNSVELYGDRDGNMTVDLEFTCRHDLTAGGWVSTRLANNIQNLV